MVDWATLHTRTKVPTRQASGGNFTKDWNKVTLGNATHYFKNDLSTSVLLQGNTFRTFEFGLPFEVGQFDDTRMSMNINGEGDNQVITINGLTHNGKTVGYIRIGNPWDRDVNSPAKVHLSLFVYN